MPAVLSWSARGARSARATPYFHSYVCLLIWSVCWSVGLSGLSRLSGYSSLPCWSDLSGGSVYLVGRIYWVVGLSIGRSVWFVWLVCLLVYLLVGSSVGFCVDLACLVCLVCLVGLVCLMVCLLVYLASLVCLLTSVLVGCLLVCLLV